MSNIRPYIIINGKDSRTITGLLITSLPPISKPAQRTLTETIDGKDGDSNIKLGFSAYDKPLGIALTYGYNVDDVISFFNSEGVITFSNEPDKYYRFEILEAIDFEKLIRFKTATVTIHTQPYKFSTTEEAKEFTTKEFNITNSGNTDSRPNLVITGEGATTMQINGKTALSIDFGDAEQTLLIDAEGMNAYYTNNIKNIEADITPKQDLHGFDSPFIDSDVVNKVPYLSRSLAGTAERIGNYEYNKLIGGTVAFNQLVENGDFSNGVTGWSANGSTISASGNKCTVTVTGSFAGVVKYGMVNSIKALSGHKFFMSCYVKNDTDYPVSIAFNNQSNYTQLIFAPSVTPNNSGYSQTIGTYTSDTDALGYLFIRRGTTNYTPNETFEVSNVNFIDLTQMLGATIADYIYSLEQAQAGAGVAYFRALFSADYYPYNAGELMSVKTSAHVTKKANNTVIQTVALDPNLELRGVPKLDDNNKLYYDGDTYKSNGTITRRFGIVDLGTLNYSYISEYTTFYSVLPAPAVYMTPNLIAGKFYTTSTTYYADAPDKSIGVYMDSNGYIGIKDTAYSDGTALKTALDGVYLVYELATYTTEQGIAFTNPIAIDANGSEEFTDSRAVAIPVGHESYYANICDIEGFTEVNLVRAGVNLWDGTGEDGKGMGRDGGTYPNATLFVTDYIKIKPNAVYYLNSANWQNWVNIYTEPNLSGFVGQGSIVNSNFVAPANCYYARFTGSLANKATACINYPASDTDYHAYSGEIFNAEFLEDDTPLTVYGGKYNFLTGLLEITQKKEIYNGSENWRVHPTDVTAWFYYTNNIFKNETTNIISNMFKYDARRWNEQGTVWTLYNQIHVRPNNAIAPSGQTAQGLAEFIAFLNDNPLEICAELAEPIFIELDAQAISALLGINNFYADTGDVTVTFVNDGQDETQTGIIVTFDLDESDLNKGDLANRLVSGNYDNIRLKAGSNAIKFTGSVNAVGFDKYSRWL